MGCASSLVRSFFTSRSMSFMYPFSRLDDALRWDFVDAFPILSARPYTFDVSHACSRTGAPLWSLRRPTPPAYTHTHTHTNTHSHTLSAAQKKNKCTGCGEGVLVPASQ